DHEEDDVVGRHPPRIDAHRGHLRHELPLHARARRALGLPGLAGRHGGPPPGALRLLPPPAPALTLEPAALAPPRAGGLGSASSRRAGLSLEPAGWAQPRAGGLAGRSPTRTLANQSRASASDSTVVWWLMSYSHHVTGAPWAWRTAAVSRPSSMGTTSSRRPCWTSTGGSSPCVQS